MAVIFPEAPADFRGYFIAMMWDQNLVGDNTKKGGKGQAQEDPIGMQNYL